MKRLREGRFVKVGILAVQGAFARHRVMFDALGVPTVDVRTPAQLDDVDALVLPGGESTTMSMLLDRSALMAPLQARLDAGMPALGTCAGMILLAREVLDGRADQHLFAAIDITVRRNAFGRQVDSFEADLLVSGLENDPELPMRSVFIRAPVVVRAGPSVEVLAEVDGAPVACQQGPVLVAAFHPELGTDTRLHRAFLSSFP